ncbi:hypothetical protein ABIB27_001487 [Arthrobacter sp. UYEF21]
MSAFMLLKVSAGSVSSACAHKLLHAVSQLSIMRRFFHGHMPFGALKPIGYRATQRVSLGSRCSRSHKRCGMLRCSPSTKSAA